MATSGFDRSVIKCAKGIQHNRFDFQLGCYRRYLADRVVYQVGLCDSSFFSKFEKNQ